MKEKKEEIPVKKTTGITTPNDDEEVLKNGEESMKDRIKKDKEYSHKNKNKKSQNSEARGITQ